MFNQKTKNTILLSCLIVVLISQIVQLGRYSQVRQCNQSAIVAPTVTLTPTPSATTTPWVRQDILINPSNNGIGLDIWADNIKIDQQKINEVEGVLTTTLLPNGHMIYAEIDPRYNKDLVAKKIADLLLMSRTD